MFGDIRNWIAGCNKCLVNKIKRQKVTVFLSPHDLTKRCWEDITAEFVTEFPERRKGHYAVLVVVDKMSKRVILIAPRKTSDTPEVAQLFEAHVF